jgi:hypothetical protein
VQDEDEELNKRVDPEPVKRKLADWVGAPSSA